MVKQMSIHATQRCWFIKCNMIELIIYIRGIEFQRKEVEPPFFEDLHDDIDINFQLNCDRRKEFIDHEKYELKMKFIRQIMKVENNYDIILHATSKMNMKEFNEDLFTYKIY